MRIAWFEPAIDDVEGIVDRIAQDSPTAAARVAGRIRDAVSLLTTTPEMGRPGYIPRTRELIVRPYIVAYRIRGQVVEILAVIDSRRGNIGEIIAERLE